ncbi:hypothetical protein GWE18_19910 [Bradyrhizobium sp. CSA112]|uniref:hypothetical protein n=1 Tax=Bradyrhizobium sp. CSA112 TaxID=2699170 RepID=UPI0023AF22BB|nr:hypothetical protein [Bradyrhizobium sp. CSA112]MDE5455067.1 hypothetical protein [Bradyrhizobium sp. CSA112]
MSNVDPTRLVADLIAGERLTTPTVKPIEPEVRSGGYFPFCDLLKHSAGADTDQLVADSVLLGALVIEWGYDVPFNKHEDFKTWLVTKEAQIVAEQPTGVYYRGTYAVSATSEKHSGLYRTIWSFRTLAALETFSDSIHTGSEFARLVNELCSYRDRERGADSSQEIYQPVRCAHRFG